MGRELAEGPGAVLGTLSEVERLRPALSAALATADRVVLIGTGASLAAIRAAAPLMRGALGSREIVVRQSADAVLGDLDGLPFGRSDLVVAVSQSGTSPETLAAARLATGAGSRVLAVTAHAGSPLALAASLVLPLASGDENDASTKSALATLAALLAIAGVLPSDRAAATAIADGLRGVVTDAEPTTPAAAALDSARRVWFVGFGAALGLAEAGALLWHEKVIRPAVAATPSEFRHGLIEAVAAGDAVVLIEVDEANPGRTGYLDRLRGELVALDVALVEVAPRVDGSGPGIRALEALVRLQLLARATALRAGTYRDGFVILRRVVTAATELLD